MASAKTRIQAKLLSCLPPGKPRFISPMLCGGTKEVPTGEDWLLELKLDGYRAIAIKDGDRVSLVSRNNKDLGHPQIVEKIGKLPVESVVLDGELVALDGNGLPSFQGLQNLANHWAQLPDLFVCL